MSVPRIQLPDNIEVIDRPGFRGRRFTTKDTEARIRREREEREAKWAIRCQRRENFKKNTHVEIETQKNDNIIQLRESLLQELAIRENTLKECNSVPTQATYDRMLRNWEKVLAEIEQALRTLF
ncbi:hypothetical protein LTS17_005380 [Exophiala oligosperma]